MFSTLASVQVTQTQYRVTIKYLDGKQEIREGPFPDHIKTTTMMHILIFSELLSTVQGNLNFECNYTTVINMYKEQNKWIYYSEDQAGKYSQLISETFSKMRDRKVKIIPSSIASLE